MGRGLRLSYDSMQTWRTLVCRLYINQHPKVGIVGFFFFFFWLVCFLTSSSTTRLYRGWAPRQSVWQFNVLPHMRQSWETMTSVSAGHIILTPTQPVGSGRPQRESNPGPPHQESRALPQSYRAPQDRKEETEKGYRNRSTYQEKELTTRTAVYQDLAKSQPRSRSMEMIAPSILRVI